MLEGEKQFDEIAGEPLKRPEDLQEWERHPLLAAWNRSEREFPRNLCLHQLFESSPRREGGDGTPAPEMNPAARETLLSDRESQGAS